MISAGIRFEGPSFSNIVLQPYAEAGKHFRKALVCSEGPSLLGRVGHMGAGLFLMIPIINNVVMAIILIGFRPRFHNNLIILLEQLRAECPQTNEPQVLIDYFCPTSLFPVQPTIQRLSELEPVRDRMGIVKVKETYLLMQLCEALHHCMGEQPSTQEDLCDAFIRLGAQWQLGWKAPIKEGATWELHVGTLSMFYESDFIKAVQARPSVV